ncbi:MAG: hypothetical protein J6M39_06780 [Lachnospiraceae bacterium]|nr:hypothetical protein [Lachnospiraceae bacterium]
MAHIVVDKRDTEIMFVDRANKHYAENNEVIKYILKSDEGDSKRFKVSSFIGKSYGLSGIALEIYCIAATYYDDRPFSVASLINTYKRIFGVKGRNGSWYTAIHVLTEKHYFYKNDDGKYILYNYCRLPKNCEDAKFLIIELDEETTSAPITI